MLFCVTSWAPRRTHGRLSADLSVFVFWSQCLGCSRTPLTITWCHGRTRLSLCNVCNVLMSWEHAIVTVQRLQRFGVMGARNAPNGHDPKVGARLLSVAFWRGQEQRLSETMPTAHLRVIMSVHQCTGDVLLWIALGEQRGGRSTSRVCRPYGLAKCLISLPHTCFFSRF
jgi:hypothetical protein